MDMRDFQFDLERRVERIEEKEGAVRAESAVGN